MGSIPQQEIPVLEQLITIRHKLSALKKDRDSYLNKEVIFQLFQDTEEQVEILGKIRDSHVWDADLRNRVNDVLDDVMSLLSLFYMTVGGNRKSPAVYAQLVTVERFLEQLSQMGVYTDSILVEIEKRLLDVESIIHHQEGVDGNNTQTCFVTLLAQKCDLCKEVLERLRATIRDVSPELKPIQDELVELRRQLAMTAQRPSGFTAKDIHPFQEKIRQIDKKQAELSSYKDDGSAPRGQELIVGLLEQLYEETHDLIVSTQHISDVLLPISDRLKEIKGQLERLSLTHRWTLRETDLYTFQLQLQEVEKLRVEGKFRDPSNAESVPDGQTLINFLLRGCYRLMSKMLSENVPVSEALMPIHNQLSTLRRCLIEVTKLGKPDSVRDLYPYQLKLASIDNARVKGIFYDEEGNIPEGQAICITLLNECYDILHDLKAAVDEEKQPSSPRQ